MFTHEPASGLLTLLVPVESFTHLTPISSNDSAPPRGHQPPVRLEFGSYPYTAQHHGVGGVAGVEEDDGAGAALGEVACGDVAGYGDGF